MARALTDDEVRMILANDPALAARVAQHVALVNNIGWDQTAWIRRDDLPIPVRGYTAQTSLGSVIIFADTNGTLHYTLAESPDELSVATEVMQPSYASPDEGIVATLNDMISRAGGVAANLLTFAAFGVGLYLAFQLYREFK